MGRRVTVAAMDREQLCDSLLTWVSLALPQNSPGNLECELPKQILSELRCVELSAGIFGCDAVKRLLYMFI